MGKDQYNNRTTILAVDKNLSNLALLSQFLSREGYEVVGISSIEKFEEKIIECLPIELAVIDISGFDRLVWNCCEHLRNLDIPFLLISPQQSAVIQQQAIKHGANQILVKPLKVKQFLLIISNIASD